MRAAPLSKDEKVAAKANGSQTPRRNPYRPSMSPIVSIT